MVVEKSVFYDVSLCWFVFIMVHTDSIKNLKASKLKCVL